MAPDHQQHLCDECRRRFNLRNSTVRGSNPGPSTRQVCFFLLAATLLSLDGAKSLPRGGINKDPCFDNKAPRQCAPSIDFLQSLKKVKVSETCGDPKKEEFCHLVEAEGGRVEQVCDNCQRRGDKSYPAKYLTDNNDTGNPTYWQSKAIHRGPAQREITLTVSFGKRFELAYITLTFHSHLPQALAIYKSTNHGKTWDAYQYYARDCLAQFNLPNKNFANDTNEREVLCAELADESSVRGGRLIFNTLDGRPSGTDIDKSFIMQDWVTATNVRFVLDPAPSAQSPTSRGSRAVGIGKGEPRHRHLGYVGTYTMRHALEKPVRGSNAPPFASGAPRSEFHFTHYAISDISIGGVCKCNGHASQCIIKKGKLACDCKHNTDGVDCERCKKFHYQRPWKRATKENANECVACHCNLHSTRCRFDAELYRKTGVGGICHKCRDHTMGRFCDKCKPGFRRNNATSIASTNACKPCNCHTVGGAGKICHPISGQCPCKDGVTGKRCNRCAKGYEQTSSVLVPCVRTAAAPKPTPAPKCPRSCQTRSAHIRVNKFCKADFVVQMKVVQATQQGKQMAVIIQVIKSFIKGRRQVREKYHDIKVKLHHHVCKCLQLNEKYLLLGKFDRSGGKRVMTINKNSIVLPWHRRFRKLARKQVKKARRKGC